VLIPSQWLHVEGANKEDPYTIVSRVSTFGEEKSRVFNPRTRKLRKALPQGPGRDRIEV
jgi:hypothetical protein